MNGPTRPRERPRSSTPASRGRVPEATPLSNGHDRLPASAGALQPGGEQPSNRRAVYTIIETAGKRAARWLRIGIAFVNRDGSLNVILDALPVTGTLHIREFPPRDTDEASE